MNPSSYHRRFFTEGFIGQYSGRYSATEARDYSPPPYLSLFSKLQDICLTTALCYTSIDICCFLNKYKGILRQYMIVTASVTSRLVLIKKNAFCLSVSLSISLSLCLSVNRFSLSLSKSERNSGSVWYWFNSRRRENAPI